MTDASRAENLADLPDEQLIQRYQRGDMESFQTLMRRYRNELFHFLVRFTGDRAAAEDVFQETFLQIHLSANTFDPERRFKPWLFTIAANKARDYLRKVARRSAAPLSAPVGGGDETQTFADLMEADLPLPGEGMQEAELQEKVQHAVAELPDHLREILLLAYFQQFSYAQIAEILNIPLGTVKSRLHTAVAKFGERWKNANPESSGA